VLVPDFQDGCLLTVATDALPVPGGDCVVALIHARMDALVGASYHCMRINADSDLFQYILVL
jgi:hypothetical protein